MQANDLKQRFPKNHIVIDRAGRPSVMVYVEKFYLDEVIQGASHTPHPAFVVRGQEIDGVYISKFQNVLIDGLAYSLVDWDPAVAVDFDRARKACTDKGEGFHLMSAAEWSALALWCQKNDCLPYGNNDGGKDVHEESVVARLAYCDEESGVCRTATGTGPVTWSHNRCPDGIYDLNANVWEWIGGMRLVYGELQVLPWNNAASVHESQDACSKAWRAIDATSGSFLLPDGSGTTENSVKLDFIGGCWTYISGAIASRRDEFRFCNFFDMTADSSIGQGAKEMLYALTCLPIPAFNDLSVSFYANNGGAERIPFRGGRWGQGLNAGVFKTCFDDPRTYSGEAVGFRSAYYELPRK